jgi:predicted TPR repeat methyltransferase
MTSSFSSSHNTLLDRRFDYAKAFVERHEYAAALDLLQQTVLENDVTWSPMWHLLGEVYRQLGDKDAAKAAYEHALLYDLDDLLGSRLGIALCCANGGNLAQLPSAYVERLFDEYAPRFDAHLQHLQYRAPDLLMQALHNTLPSKTALDLGCGSGLMGKKLRPFVKTLHGCDVSKAMLKQAAQKNVYDRLEHVDLLTALQHDKERYTLIVAADVLVYLGGLSEVFQEASTALTPSGVFAFTTQATDATNTYQLGDDHRFAHSAAYLQACATAVGFSLTLKECVPRFEKNKPVQGWCGIAKK